MYILVLSIDGAQVYSTESDSIEKLKMASENIIKYAIQTRERRSGIERRKSPWKNPYERRINERRIDESN